MIDYRNIPFLIKKGLPRWASKYIIVHCSDTKPKMDIGVKEIDQWHKEKGWVGVGYNYVIRRDGTLEGGRAFNVVGSHAKGYNGQSIGICLVGGKSEDGRADDNFTISQQAMLRELILAIQRDYPKIKIIGHRDVDKGKLCPCFNVVEWCNKCGITKI